MKDQEFIAQKIRAEYTQKEDTALDELKALDARVKRPANVFGYVYGSIGSIIMGSGMSLVMTDIGAMLVLHDAMPLGIAVGLVGIVMVLSTYGAPASAHIHHPHRGRGQCYRSDPFPMHDPQGDQRNQEDQKWSIKKNLTIHTLPISRRR